MLCRLGPHAGRRARPLLPAVQTQRLQLRRHGSAEIERLVRNREGRLCARFYARPDGTLLTQNCPVGFRAKVRRISRAAGAVLSAATAAMSATYVAAQTATGTSQSTPSKRSDAALSLEVIDQSGAVITNAKVSLISHKRRPYTKARQIPKARCSYRIWFPGSTRSSSQQLIFQPPGLGRRAVCTDA